ncbi:MAG: tail fiber protein [bacterium]|nr:tail fiber protein [bacterium]
MKKKFRSSIVCLFSVIIISITGCEAGLSSDDSAGSEGSGESGFSFSDIYTKMKNMQQEINSLNATASPVGTIVPYGGTSIPDGWKLCDGTVLSRTEYAELFSKIGTAWGTSNASSFNLPDLRGVFLRGVSGTSGMDPDKNDRTPLKPGGNSGNTVGSYQDDIIERHLHPNRFAALTPSNGVEGGGLRRAAQDEAETEYNEGGGNETRPKNVYVNYIIKYE